VLAFITWTKNLLEEYGATFRKQVYLKDVDKNVIEEAIHVTHSQSRKVGFKRRNPLSVLTLPKLLQEYGLDFRYMFHEILVEDPKKLTEVKTTLSLDDYSITRSTSIIKKLEQKQLTPLTEATPIPGAPTPPVNLTPPPPLNHRKSPGRTAKAPPPPLNNESLYALPSANEALVPPSAGFKLGGNVLSPNSVGSTYSSRFENASTNAPLFSSRPNPAPFTPLSAMRARTPVSAALHQEQATPPDSAPIPQANPTSPLPRPPLSAMPQWMRDRSDSVKSKDGTGTESIREGGGLYNERPPRSARGSPAVVSRSANRPGSSTGQRTPAAVAQHEGMI